MKRFKNMLEVLFAIGVNVKLVEVEEQAIADFYVKSNNRCYKIVNELKQQKGYQIYKEIDSLKKGGRNMRVEKRSF